MKPTSLLRRSRDQISSKFAKPVSITLKGRGCPFGTVPIRRINKEDLIREKFTSKMNSFEDSTLGDHVSLFFLNSEENFLNHSKITRSTDTVIKRIALVGCLRYSLYLENEYGNNLHAYTMNMCDQTVFTMENLIPI